MAKPWMDTDDLIASVKRKISMPIAQVSFTNDDILAFMNEEMMISQVPAVLSYHEEYFVYRKVIPIVTDQDRYAIPDRAIGLRLRDVYFQDTNGNLFEMTRVPSDDQAYYQRNVGATQAIGKFFLEGNNIVLSPKPTGGNSGSIVFTFFLRPNQLVSTDRAATIQNFKKSITVDNTFLTAGDTITVDGVTLTAVSGSPSTNEFQIGGSSIISATNLKNALITAGFSADNGSPATAIVTVTFNDRTTEFSTTDTSAFAIQSTLTINFDAIPTNITSSTLIDFLQTKPGHQIYNYDISISSISGTTMTFADSDIPDTLIVGDYVCEANECIIPQLPSDLHNGLAERTGARILAAMGDTVGLQMSAAKIGEIKQSEGTLLNSRVDGSTEKVTGRHSILRFSRLGTRRRL